MSKVNNLLKKYNSYLTNNNTTNFNKINNIRAQFFEVAITDKISKEEEEKFKIYDDLFFKKFFDSFPNNYKKYIKFSNKFFDKKYYDYKNKEKKLFNDLDKLLLLRNDYANSMGFNNYYDYMFVEDNKYFYNYNKVLKIRRFVLEYLVPLNNSMDYKSFDYKPSYLKSIKSWIIDNFFDTSNFINELESNESWHLLYYPYSNKYNIYCKYKNNEKDIYNLAHEYGHIFQLVNNELFDLVTIDYALAEVFSSYSEILCVKNINNNTLINNHIHRILEIIISSVATDEFLEYLYKHIDDSIYQKDNAWENINKKYSIVTSKKWYDDKKRIKYPYRCIDYAIAYISTLYSYNSVSISNYKKLKKDYYDNTYTDIIKNNNLGNPFNLKTYKSICANVKEIINED